MSKVQTRAAERRNSRNRDTGHSDLGLISDAILHPDENVSKPHDPAERNSFTARLEALKLGESEARADALDPALRLVDLPDALPPARLSMRNSVGPMAQRAAKRTGKTYTVEVSDLQTLSGRMYVVAIVTCIKLPDDQSF